MLRSIVLLTIVQLLAGALASGSAARRWAAVAIATLGLAVPLQLPTDDIGLRFLVALGAVMTLLRTLDLHRDRRPRSPLFRILHVIIAFDTRRLHRAPARVSVAEIAKVVAYASLAAAALAAVIAAGPSGRPAALAGRWIAGAAFVYALTDSAYRSVTVLTRAAGFEIYELHRTPAAALSVKEFWGDRWNRTVMAWFREHCLKPLAKRGSTRGGLIASFAASALFHAYLVIVSLGVPMALLTLAYFLLQAVLVVFEIAVRIDRRSRPARRAWTLGMLLLTSPLFVEPSLRVLGF